MHSSLMWTSRVPSQVGLGMVSVLLGSQIEHMSNDDLSHVVEIQVVIAKSTPLQKDRVVRTLKDSAHVAGCMGGNITEVPAAAR